MLGGDNLGEEREAAALPLSRCISLGEGLAEHVMFNYQAICQGHVVDKITT